MSYLPRGFAGILLPSFLVRVPLLEHRQVAFLIRSIYIIYYVSSLAEGEYTVACIHESTQKKKKAVSSSRHVVCPSVDLPPSFASSSPVSPVSLFQLSLPPALPPALTPSPPATATGWLPLPAPTPAPPRAARHACARSRRAFAVIVALTLAGSCRTCLRPSWFRHVSCFSEPAVSYRCRQPPVLFQRERGRSFL